MFAGWQGRKGAGRHCLRPRGCTEACAPCRKRSQRSGVTAVEQDHLHPLPDPTLPTETPLGGSRDQAGPALGAGGTWCLRRQGCHPAMSGSSRSTCEGRPGGCPIDAGFLEVQPSVGREAAEQLGLVRATRLRCRASPPSSAPAEGRTAWKMPQPSGLLRVSWANTPFTSQLSEVNICLSLLSALCCDATN